MVVINQFQYHTIQELAIKNECDCAKFDDVNCSTLCSNETASMCIVPVIYQQL